MKLKKDNLQFLEKQNCNVCLRHLITFVFSTHMRSLWMCVCVCRLCVHKRPTRSLILKRKNEYLNYVKETAKTPLSIAICGQLRGMLSLTSYCSYIVYPQRAFTVFFSVCLYIYIYTVYTEAGTWVFGVSCIYTPYRCTRKFNPKTYMFIFYCSKDKLCPNQHAL